jgi:hypothetical protein
MNVENIRKVIESIRTEEHLKFNMEHFFKRSFIEGELPSGCIAGHADFISMRGEFPVYYDLLGAPEAWASPCPHWNYY